MEHGFLRELDLQIQFVQFYDAYCKENDIDCVLDSGYYDNIDAPVEKVREARMAGRRAGMPDVRIYWPTLKYCALFLEFKRPDLPCVYSDKQKIVAEKLKKSGYQVHCVNNLEMAKKVFFDYIDG